MVDATRSLIAPLDEVESPPISVLTAPTGATPDPQLDLAENITAITTIIGALDSPIRIRILLALNEREHFVHELVSLVGTSQPLVSQHLKVLKSAHLVSATRRGRQMAYCLKQPLVLELLKLALSTTQRPSA